jgi:secondary thiamine-phosphate synthase enzyme
VVEKIEIQTQGQGLVELTDQVLGVVHGGEVSEGLCTIYIQHTSASLIIQENADPSVRCDLEHWLNRLVKEGDPLFTHTSEGPDDMPSHLKSVLTCTSISIPIVDGTLALGTWQGIYLWEHRKLHHRRSVLVHVM